jgi:hypothetical protein
MLGGHVGRSHPWTSWWYGRILRRLARRRRSWGWCRRRRSSRRARETVVRQDGLDEEGVRVAQDPQLAPADRFPMAQSVVRRPILPATTYVNEHNLQEV